jgi:transcriptional regulator with XRE-family HTH domain
VAFTEVVTLARRVRAARALSGKEVAELAAEVGVSKRTYWRLEKGDREPTALELERIAEATGQSLDFFFGASSLSPAEAPNLPLLPGAVNPDQEA